MDPNLLARIDHLVNATPDLDRAVDELAVRFGVRATPGGQHLGRGTRNALMALGPECYLEIIGPDRGQPEPASPRWFGIDTLDESRLVAWAARAHSIDLVWATARRQGLFLGGITNGSRQGSDGSPLHWRYTEPVIDADPAIPFLIDWGESIHPARSAAPGCALADFFVQHTDVAGIRHALDLLDVHVRAQPGPAPALIATIDSPNGRVTLR